MEAQKLQEGEFCQYKIGLLHGKMTGDEKDEGIIMAFRRENSPFDTFAVEFEKEYDITPLKYIDELQGMEKTIFQKLFANAA